MVGWQGEVGRQTGGQVVGLEVSRLGGGHGGGGQAGRWAWER